MTPLQLLYTEAVFRLSQLTWVEIVDILLVTTAFYIMLRLMQRSRATFLLRGVLVLSMALFVVSVLLPLPAFVWVVRTVLVAIFIATPIILQPELRRLLERVGRTAGLTTAVRQTTTEKIVPQVVRAIENMANTHTGALIVIEGQQSLQDVVETGVAIGGQVTSELLQAIFYPENPLHDGAVILREDKVVAAGCVLPLAQQMFILQRRLGTRHQAAVGVSEHSDALVIVASEETGAVSIVRNGQLQYGIDSAVLREQLFDFIASPVDAPVNLWLWRLLDQAGHSIWKRPSLPGLRQFFVNIGLLLGALLLALVVWSFVIQQTNPARRALVEDILLRVEDIPAGTALVSSPPAAVSTIIQTTDDVLATISVDSFRAEVSLDGLGPGLHHLPVQVSSGASPLRILSVTPSMVDVEIAAIISKTIPVTIDLLDMHRLPPAYRISGTPTALPDSVQVVGPAPVVEQVQHAQAVISVADASASLQEVRPLRALDGAGREISGVNLQPGQTRVSVPVRRRLDTLEVGVRAAITGTPPSGYWLSGVSVNPASVTLRGDQEQLMKVGSFINTLPVDVSQATGDFSIEIPLELTPSLQALNGNSVQIQTVTVLAKIAPRQGDLALNRPVQLITNRSGITTTIVPSSVDVLLNGPLPTLAQIERDPNLVQITVDARELNSPQTINVSPQVVVPAGVRAQVVPSTVEITISP